MVHKVKERLSKPPNIFILINKWDKSDEVDNANEVKGVPRARELIHVQDVM